MTAEHDGRTGRVSRPRRRARHGVNPDTLLVGSLRSALYHGSLVLVIPMGLGLAVLVAYFTIFSIFNPTYSALMGWRSVEGQSVAQGWVPLDRVSPHLVRAVIASEDARFCRHAGIDWRALNAAFARAKNNGDGSLGQLHGASTISMQVVKNLMLWPGRTLARKALELMITPVMEVFWSKRRIMEVYLNIAEWGPGVFGAQAASLKHFGKPAAAVDRREAALLAAALPNPMRRVAGKPSRILRRQARRVLKRVRGARTDIRCLRL